MTDAMITRLYVHAKLPVHVAIPIEMASVLGYTGPRKTWANEMNGVMNHVPGAGPIARTVDQQSSMLPLSHGCPPPPPQ